MIQSGQDAFCERCGNRVGVATVEAKPLTGLLDFVRGRAAPVPDSGLRLCLGCRGYVCPACINETESVCLTCAPRPVVEAEATLLADVVALPPAEPEWVPEPGWVAASESGPEAGWVPEPPTVAEPEAAEPQPEPVAAEPQPEPVAPPASTPPAMPPPARPGRRIRAPHFAPPPPPRPAPDMPELTFVPPSPLPPAAPLAPRFRPPVARPPSPPSATPWIPPPAPPAMPPAAASFRPMAYAPPPRPQPMVPPPHLADGLRACHSCLLPLSARAGFCRRCGTAQAPLA